MWRKKNCKTIKNGRKRAAFFVGVSGEAGGNKTSFYACFVTTGADYLASRHGSGGELSRQVTAAQLASVISASLRSKRTSNYEYQ